MLRNVGAVIAGLIVGNLLIGGIELINQSIAPPFPADLKMGDTARLRAWVETVPTAAFLVVLTAWATGSFGGPFTTALLARGPRMILACVVGGFFWIATLAMLILIPGPWFMWLGLLIVPTMTLAGAALALKVNPSKTAGPQPYDMREKGMACK